ASLRDLTHGVPLKIFAEIRFAHDALPASKLGKKASTNLGAIHAELCISQYEAEITSIRILNHKGAHFSNEMRCGFL
ncbi:hypothetical protein, partial [Ensifer sp. ENS05]|uniref:hypothetical protein n=1 Tax=Ensifer sp. ENS05 TaxID=2769277 RepID=UPI001AEE29C2